MKKSRSPIKSEEMKESQQFSSLEFGWDYFNVLPVPILFIDNNLIIKRVNIAAAGLFDNSINDIHFSSLFILNDTNEKAIPMADLFNGKERIRQEILSINKAKFTTFMMNAIALKDNIGIISGYLVTLADITEQIDGYNNISEELKEKTILLKEIHHRIKNNLQIINSILSLQMYYMQNKDLNAILTGLQARIRTIALIHEKLYQTDNPSEINICNFLKDLQKILIQIYDLNTDLIIFSCDIDEIFLETEIALQLGLIINELTTNSVKYAFPSGKGKIDMSFKFIDNKYELHFKDDGVGMPEDFLSKKTETLGSQLLESLIEQLEGTSEIKTGNGTEFIIKFPRIQA